MPAVTPTSVGAVDTPDVLPVDQATAIAATQSYAQQAQAALAAIPAAVAADVAGKLAKASNLSDLADAPAARSNLGLGTMATQAANAVAITGGSISNLTTFDGVTIDGGTY